MAARHAARIAARCIGLRASCLKRITKNLLRDSMHPQGVGRWVSGGNAATLPHAASRGARSFAYPLGMSQLLRSVLLALETLATVLGNLLNTGHLVL